MATLDEGNILMTFIPLCSSQMFGAARSVFRLKCTKAGKAFNSSLLGLKRKFVHHIKVPKLVDETQSIRRSCVYQGDFGMIPIYHPSWKILPILEARKLQDRLGAHHPHHGASQQCATQSPVTRNWGKTKKWIKSKLSHLEWPVDFGKVMGEYPDSASPAALATQFVLSNRHL